MVPAAGGASRALTDKLDRAVTSFAFAADSAGIMITVEDDARAYPARIDLARDTITREGSGGAFVVSALSSSAGHTALLESNDSALAELHALEAGKLRKLTAHNDAFLSELDLGAVEDIRFKSKDGTEIHALLVKPPDYVPGRKYPTVLWIHGGPNGGDEHSLELDGYQFEPQMFAAQGYVVLRVNYRGGSGRGIAYAKAIFADWGHKEVEDLLAGVDHLIASGIADPERLAIGGSRPRSAVPAAAIRSRPTAVINTYCNTITSWVRRGVTQRYGSKCHILSFMLNEFTLPLYSSAARRTSTSLSWAVSRCTRR